MKFIDDNNNPTIWMVLAFFGAISLFVHSVILGANYFPWLNYQLAQLFMVPK